MVRYRVNGKLVGPNGEAVEDVGDMTADEVLEAVEGGELGKDEALEAESKRSKPRKTVTEKLG